MQDGGAGLLFQVLDTGPGLRGREYRLLFDPSHETGWRWVGFACDSGCTPGMMQAP